MKNEILIVCNQLVSAAANGVYQGIIIAILVAVGLRLLARTNAATRHAVWFCTMLLLVVLIVAHCLVDSFPLQCATSNDIAPLSSAELELPSTDAGVVPEPMAATGTSSPASTDVHDDFSAGSEEQSNPERGPLPLSLIQAQHSRVGNVIPPEPAHGIEPGHAESNAETLTSSISGEVSGLRWLVERLVNPVSGQLALGSKFPRVAGVIILALWLTIAGFRVIALILQLARIQRLKLQSFPPGAELGELFQKLSVRLDGNRRVELRVSPMHRSSFLLGFMHPVILLPAEERMEPAEAELVLRHELAHVRRRDDWVNLIQHFFLAVFFFHPAFWWISKRLSLEREIACDDHVLQQSRRPQAYALVLASLAARMQRMLPLLAPGSSNNKTQLKERIDMILNTHRNASPRLARTWLAFITSTVALVALAIVCSAPRIVLAQIETAAAAANAPSADEPSVASVNDIASVAAFPALPDSDSADLVPPTAPLPAAIDRGPKFKPGNLNVDVRPAVVVTPPAPVPVAATVVVGAPASPTPFIASIEPPSEAQARRAPRPVRAPRSENSDSSLEERLDRLERMIDSLVNQQNSKDRAGFYLKAEKDGMIDRKEMARIEATARQPVEHAWKINPQEIEKIKEQAQHEAKRAIEQTKRAAAEVEKARRADQKQADRKLKEGSQKQLEALRKQIEILERQREKLDRQIEQLEQEQEELDEQDEDSADSDTQVNESKEECVTQSSTAR